MDDAHWWVYPIKGKLYHFGYFNVKIVPDFNIGCPVVIYDYLMGKIGSLPKINQLGEEQGKLPGAINPSVPRWYVDRTFNVVED